jgi:hypothetical protein
MASGQTRQSTMWYASLRSKIPTTPSNTAATMASCLYSRKSCAPSFWIKTNETVIALRLRPSALWRRVVWFFQEGSSAPTRCHMSEHLNFNTHMHTYITHT